MAKKTIHVGSDVQQEKKRCAQTLRSQLQQKGTFVVNMMSSPGAGKTTLLQALAESLGRRHKMAVLVGDLATDRDAERLKPYVPVQQLTTGGACHLELSLVERGLASLPAEDWEFLFIENVGNLVCPASHDLAEHMRMVLLSTTEGDDKPGKYPKMFRGGDVLVVTKCDLLPHVPFSVEDAVKDARRIQSQIEAFQTCALSRSGIAELAEYLERSRAQVCGQLSRDENSLSSEVATQ